MMLKNNNLKFFVVNKKNKKKLFGFTNGKLTFKSSSRKNLNKAMRLFLG